VKSDIVEQERIRGEIISIQSQEKFAETKEYITEYFIVTVLFENGIQRKSTNVSVKKRDENV
jgi:hypothetical protein